MFSSGTLNIMRTIDLINAPTCIKVCFVCQKLSDEVSKIFTNRGRLDVQDCLKKYVCLDVPDGWICRSCKRRLHGIKMKVDEFRKSVMDADCKFRRNEFGKNTQTADIQKSKQDTGRNKVIGLTGKRIAACPKGSKGKTKQTEQKLLFRTIIPKFKPGDLAPKQVDSAQLPVDKASGTGSSGQIVECPPAEDEPSNVVDHSYAIKMGQTKECPPSKEVKLLQGVLVRTPTLIDRTQYHCLLSAVQSQSTDIIISEILRIPTLREILVCKLADELGSRPDKQRSDKTGELSVLMQKDFLDLKMHSWEDIICEFITKYPELVEILLKLMLGPEALKNATKIQQIIPKLATVYGIVLQHRNHELSRVQRLVGCLFADNVVEQKVYDRLNKLGVCSSYNRMQEVRRGAAALSTPAVSNSKKRKAQKYAGTPGFSEIGEMFDQETDVVRRSR